MAAVAWRHCEACGKAYRKANERFCSRECSDNYFPDDPTEEELEAALAEIRDGWTDRDWTRHWNGACYDRSRTANMVHPAEPDPDELVEHEIL